MSFHLFGKYANMVTVHTPYFEVAEKQELFTALKNRIMFNVEYSQSLLIWDFHVPGNV